MLKTQNRRLVKKRIEKKNIEWLEYGSGSWGGMV